MSATDPRIAQRATELAIAERDCDWCIAKAGELCYPEPTSTEAAAGTAHGYRHWSNTHMSRFAGLGDPAEYVARHDAAGGAR